MAEKCSSPGSSSTVILFAYLDFKSIKMTLEGNSLIDLELAEEKRGYGWAVGFHDISG
jgi:hypothetical protein